MLQANIRTKIKNFPILLLLVVYLTACIGLSIMYGISTPSKPLFQKQVIHLILASILMFSVALIDIKVIFLSSYIVYFISILILLSVGFVGYTAMGATRWINLGFIKLQPSELMKISLTLALSRYFHSMKYEYIGKIRTLFIPVALIAIPLVTLLKQPDLGTAITISAVAIIILFLAGIKTWKFASSTIAFIASLPVVWNYMLYDYQKKRILTFLNPERDTLGSGYNIIQSKIAIGSGGFFGKGHLEGTQTQLDFLPEYQTDFVFALFAEEYGFIGSVLLITMYVIIITCGIYIATNCKNTYGKLLVFGLISIFSVHAFINIGMVSGLLPVVGIPLPLISYGGSSLTTTLIAVGLIINVKVNHKERIAQV